MSPRALSQDPIRVAMREAKAAEKKEKKEDKIQEVKQQNAHVSDLNALEEFLNPANYQPQPNEPDTSTVMLLELEKQKLEMAKIFMSDTLQKTQVNVGERKLLPLMHILANNPFAVAERVRGQYKHKELTSFMSQYLSLGIPLDRKGRLEEVRVMESLLGKDMELKQEEEGGVKGFVKRMGR